MKMKPRILINLNLILKELKFTINKHFLREKNLVQKENAGFDWKKQNCIIQGLIKNWTQMVRIVPD